MTLPLDLSIYFSGSGLNFSAEGLPQGLVIDQATGLVSGAPGQAGASAVTVTATNDGGQATAAFSWLIEAAAAQQAPVNTALPSISGTPSVGQNLAAAAGGWAGNPTPVFTYQWLRNGAAIPAATSPSYLLGAADDGASIAIRVTGTNPAGAASALSAGVTVSAAPVAPVVIGLMGQSDLDRLIKNDPVFISTQPFPTITNPNCIVVNADEGADTVSEVTITNAAIAANQINLTMATLAAFLGWKYPTRTFVFLDLAVSGTPRNALYDDANGLRDWSDFQRVVDYAETTHKLPDLIIDYWYAGDSSVIASFGPTLGPFYIGQRIGGGAFTLGTVNPDNPGYGTIDHCLWDAEAAPDEKGRGVFTRDGTKLLFVNRAQYNLWNTFSAEQAALDAFLADPRVPAFSTERVSAPLMAKFDASSGHTTTNDVDGHPGWARRLMEAVSRFMGEDVQYPEVVEIVEDELDAKKVRIVYSLPNGGDLTTFLALEDRTFSEDYEARQPVTGVEIRRLGDDEDERQPVWPLAETGKPSAYRGDVEIEDSGSGSPRRGTVLVTMEEDLNPGDRVYVNWQNNNIVPGGTEIMTGDALKPWMGFPVETVAALTDETALYPFAGMPAKLFPAPRQIGALPAPSPSIFWTQGNPAPGWLDPSALPTGTGVTRIRFEAVVRLPSSALPLAVGSSYLAHQVGLYWGVRLIHSTRVVDVQRSEFRDSAGALLLPSTDYTIFTLPLDQWVRIVVDADLANTSVSANGHIIAYVDGVPTAPQAFAANSGAFASGGANRRLCLFNRNGGVNLFPPGAQVEFGQFSIDNGSGLVLHKRLEGNAATVNADAWKIGASGSAV